MVQIKDKIKMRTQQDTGVYILTRQRQRRKWYSQLGWGIKATVEGHKAKLRGNDGHGLQGLPEIPALMEIADQYGARKVS